MDEPITPMMRVREWSRLYENNRSRSMKRTEWFPVPNDLSLDSYVELVGHERGAAHLGVWIAILMVASKTKPRCGLLVKIDGRPHTAASLARVTRLPETLVTEAIGRLLEIGLLDIVSGDSPEVNDLGRHPRAGILHDRAGKPQEGAVEEKGREHHHHEGNGNEKKGTERADDQRKTDGSSAGSGADFFQRTADDEAKPAEVYASPDDELKAIYLAKAGQPITVAVLDAIRVNLELNLMTMGRFVSVLRAHLAGNWKNPPGFLRDLSRKFRAKSQHATDPVTAAEAAERDYRCSFCGSRTRGEGAILESGKTVPCRCASQEYIARQRARGVFVEEQS